MLEYITNGVHWIGQKIDSFYQSTSRMAKRAALTVTLLAALGLSGCGVFEIRPEPVPPTPPPAPAPFVPGNPAPPTPFDGIDTILDIHYNDQFLFNQRNVGVLAQQLLDDLNNVGEHAGFIELTTPVTIHPIHRADRESEVRALRNLRNGDESAIDSLENFLVAEVRSRYDERLSWANMAIAFMNSYRSQGGELENFYGSGIMADLIEVSLDARGSLNLEDKESEYILFHNHPIFSSNEELSRADREITKSQRLPHFVFGYSNGNLRYVIDVEGTPIQGTFKIADEELTFNLDNATARLYGLFDLPNLSFKIGERTEDNYHNHYISTAMGYVQRAIDSINGSSARKQQVLETMQYLQQRILHRVPFGSRQYKSYLSQLQQLADAHSIPLQPIPGSDIPESPVPRPAPGTPDSGNDVWYYLQIALKGLALGLTSFVAAGAAIGIGSRIYHSYRTRQGLSEPPAPHLGDDD